MTIDATKLREESEWLLRLLLEQKPVLTDKERTLAVILSLLNKTLDELVRQSLIQNN